MSKLLTVYLSGSAASLFYSFSRDFSIAALKKQFGKIGLPQPC